MIANEPDSVGRRDRCEIGTLVVREEVARTREGRREEMFVANADPATVLSQLFLVDRTNQRHVDPNRLTSQVRAGRRDARA